MVELEQRVLLVDGEETHLMWPVHDTSCFNIIAIDWAEMNPSIIEHTPKREIVLQAGGNCGMYPLLHSKQFAIVFTFEPDPVNFHCLTNNCPGNNIIKFNTAVGDKAEPLYMGPVLAENVGMHKIGVGDSIVYSVPIDSLNLQILSLLHLDIEGYELPALRGAEQTIMRCRPTIALEISQDVEETKSFLKHLNYTEVYSKETSSSNYIYIPSERA